MNLQVINSNSKGNSYILYNGTEALLIECGVHIKEIKKALRFNLNKVSGCLVTHEHKDHCKSVTQVLGAGIDVYATPGTHKAMGTEASHRAKPLEYGKTTSVGSFKVKAFEVEHDAAEPAGFLIWHKETGYVLFLTDSYFCKYTFPKLNQVIIEANYCHEIIHNKLAAGSTNKFLRDRVLESHMSLQVCKETLAANDLKGVCNIVLIHLSDGHSDEARFKIEVQNATGKPVHVASPGLDIDFNINPF